MAVSDSTGPEMLMYFILELILHGFFVDVTSFTDVLSSGNELYTKNCTDIGRSFDFRVHRMTLAHSSKVRQYRYMVYSIVKNEFLYGSLDVFKTRFHRIYSKEKRFVYHRYTAIPHRVPHLLSMPHDPWTTLASIRAGIPPPRVIYRPTPTMLRSLRPDGEPLGIWRFG